MGAAGLLSLLIMERDGGCLPENVARFDEPGGAPAVPEPSAALLLALLLWGELSPTKKEKISSVLRCMAYGAKHPDPIAVQLHNLLSGRRAC
jgi:hypothetical protein